MDPWRVLGRVVCHGIDISYSITQWLCAPAGHRGVPGDARDGQRTGGRGLAAVPWWPAQVEVNPDLCRAAGVVEDHQQPPARGLGAEAGAGF